MNERTACATVCGRQIRNGESLAELVTGLGEEIMAKKRGKFGPARFKRLLGRDENKKGKGSCVEHFVLLLPNWFK